MILHVGQPVARDPPGAWRPRPDALFQATRAAFGSGRASGPRRKPPQRHRAAAPPLRAGLRRCASEPAMTRTLEPATPEVRRPLARGAGAVGKVPEGLIDEGTLAGRGDAGRATAWQDRPHQRAGQGSGELATAGAGHHLFRIFSMTKPVTGIASKASSRHEGLWSPDDSIAKPALVRGWRVLRRSGRRRQGQDGRSRPRRPCAS